MDRFRRATAVAAILLAGSSCAAEPVADVATTTTGASPSTATTATTALEAAVETTTSTYRLPDGFPDGSGCTPNLTDGLPRGTWFGFLVAADLDSLTFDLACHYSGNQADIAAETDGTSAIDGVHIRNPDPATLVLEVNSGISIQDFDTAGDRFDTGTWYPQWVVATAIPEGGLPVWVVQQPERISALVVPTD